MERRIEEIFTKICEKIEKSEKSIKSELKSEIMDVKSMCQAMQKKYEELETKVKEQQDTILLMQKNMNKKNIIIHGVHEFPREKDNLKGEVVSFINEKLEVNLGLEKVESVYRMGRSTGLSIAPIKLSLTEYKVKMEVLSKRVKLKGTSIYINEDLPKELRMRNAEIRRRSKMNGGENFKKRLMVQSSEEEEIKGNKILQGLKKTKEGDGAYYSMGNMQASKNI